MRHIARESLAKSNNPLTVKVQSVGNSSESPMKSIRYSGAERASASRDSLEHTAHTRKKILLRDIELYN